MESLSLQQILEICLKNKYNTFIFILKKSSEITKYDKDGKLFINRKKGFIAPRLFIARVQNFIYGVQAVLLKDLYKHKPQAARQQENYLVGNEYFTKKFPEYFSKEEDEEGKQLIGLETSEIGILINDSIVSNDELINKYLNFSFENEEEEDFFTYNFRTRVSINPNDWIILNYDKSKFELYIQKLKQLGFENFSRYALDQGLNGDVLSVIGSFLGPLEFQLGKQINQDPLGVFQTRPFVLEQIENDKNNKKRKLQGGVKSKTRQRKQKTFSKTISKKVKKRSKKRV
jgi:hypothetical protein